MSTSDEATGLLRSAVRRDIVDTLANLEGDQRTEGLTAREIGAQVGLHASTVRFHLDQLVAAGLLTSHFVRSHGAGRPSKAPRGTRNAKSRPRGTGLLCWSGR